MVSSISPKLPGLQYLPSHWQKWHAKISELLEIDSSRPLCKQQLPQPWFLFPVQNELSEREAADLFTALRSYLQPSAYTSVAAIRERLQSLSPDASLPFLYGMRYIAFANGGNRYYWPPFRRMLFDNDIAYEDVAIGLGSTTAELWIRLFTETRAALYRPLVGPVNIKWPLAHAGLLPAHKPTLEAFGVALLHQGEDAFDETLALDSEEFILRLRDWLRRAPHHAQAPFSLLMLGSLPERYTLAELGQRWLSLEGPALKTQTHVAPAQPGALLPRRRLHYQASTHQIGILFSLGRLPIGRTATLTWNGQTWPLRFRDLSQQGVRVFDEQFLPLDGPQGSAEATVTVTPGGSTPHSLPTLDARQGLVFDAESGNLTQHWQFGEYYTILVETKLIDNEKLAHLFSDWSDLEPPLGRWPEHRLMQVRTHDPAAWEDASAEQLHALEEATEKLGLPGFAHQLRARIRLIGGDLQAYTPDRGPCFAVAAPPYAEITGRLPAYTNLVLERQQEHTVEFKAINAQWVMPGQARSQIIELPGDLLTAGRYRLCVGHECADFDLTDELDALAGAPPAALQIEASITHGGGDPVAMPNRHALEEDSGDFVLLVKAWPGADLQLQISSAVGVKPQTLPILTDGQGEWREQFSRLPIVWAALPEGDLTLTVGWRGLFTQTITAEDKTYCTLVEFGSITERSPQGGNFVFTCWGRLKGMPHDVKLFGYLLPPVPWQQPPCACALGMNSNGTFMARTLLDWQPGWIVIGDQRLLEEGNALIIAAKELPNTAAAQPPVEIDLAQELGPQVTAWHTLADRIRNVNHPAALSGYLQLASVLHCLPLVRDFLNAKPAWTAINRWEEWPRILTLLQQGAATLFHKRLTAGKSFQQVLGITLDLPPNPAEAEQLTFRFQGSNVGGLLLRVNFFGAARIFLAPNASLRACGKCGLILPDSAFLDHARPYAEMPNCTDVQPIVIQYRAGERNESEYVAIGVIADPDAQLVQIRTYLADYLRLRRLPSDAYRGLVDDLKTRCPAGQERAKWLEGLIAALDALSNLRRRYQQNPRLCLSDLVTLGTPLAGYETALTAVMTTLGLNQTSGPAVASTPKVTPKPSSAPLPQSPPQPLPQPLPVATAPASPAPTPAATPAARGEDKTPPGTPQPAQPVKQSRTPVVDVTQPPIHPTPAGAPTAQAVKQVQIVLESYDEKALDQAIGVLERQLRSAHIKVSGPFPQPNRRMLCVPADSKWEQAVKSLHLPRSVVVKSL